MIICYAVQQETAIRLPGSVTQRRVEPDVSTVRVRDQDGLRASLAKNGADVVDSGS
jgi:hypothetical protein